MRRSNNALEVLFALFLGLVLTGTVWVVFVTIWPASTAYRQSDYESWQIAAGTFLVLAATLSMIGSLALGDRARVIANGLLFSGVFTMCVAMGYILWSDRTMPRLLLMLAALAVTVVVGWIRFSRPGKAVQVSDEASSSELAARVSDLEARLRALGDVLR